jgi:hypothetical protein
MVGGPLLAAVGVLLVRRVGPGASYLVDVLPAVVVFGAGLTLLVAPLTATVLDSAPDGAAGVASGVNNAVARAAGLLAVAVVPVAAGIGGADYTDPEAFAAGFRTAMLLCAGLLVAGSLIAVLCIRGPLPTGPRIRVEESPHCPVAGPPVHPRTTAGAPRGSAT